MFKNVLKAKHNTFNNIKISQTKDMTTSVPPKDTPVNGSGDMK